MQPLRWSSQRVQLWEMTCIISLTSRDGCGFTQAHSVPSPDLSLKLLAGLLLLIIHPSVSFPWLFVDCFIVLNNTLWLKLQHSLIQLNPGISSRLVCRQSLRLAPAPAVFSTVCTLVLSVELLGFYGFTFCCHASIRVLFIAHCWHLHCFRRSP